MRSRLAVLGLLAGALSCGTSTPSGGGTGGVGGTSAAGGSAAGGTAGRGGVAGTSAAGGSGGTKAGGSGGTGGGSGGPAISGSGGSGGTVAGDGGSGDLPACGGSGGADRPVVGVVVAGPDGIAVVRAVSETVTVTAIDSCGSVSCPPITFPDDIVGNRPVSVAATRIVLTGPDSRTWLLYMQHSAMPPDLIKTNDTFDLTIEAQVRPPSNGDATKLNQTIVLAHGSELVVFLSDQDDGADNPPLPKLDTFGIAVTDDGAYCQTGSFFCGAREHAVRVAIGTDSVILAGSSSTRIGWLWVTVAGFTEAVAPFCEASGRSRMAGFRIPVGGSGGTGGRSGIAGAGGLAGGGRAGGGGAAGSED
jgi:hypothetical protein